MVTAIKPSCFSYRLLVELQNQLSELRSAVGLLGYCGFLRVPGRYQNIAALSFNILLENVFISDVIKFTLLITLPTQDFNCFLTTTKYVLKSFHVSLRMVRVTQQNKSRIGMIKIQTAAQISSMVFQLSGQIVSPETTL